MDVIWFEKYTYIKMGMFRDGRKVQTDDINLLDKQLQ